MRNQIRNLIKLQEIDSRLDDLKLQKGDLPLLIEQAMEDLQEKKNSMMDMQGKIENLEKDRRMFEMEVDASREQLKKYEDQLYRVKTNKEYDAISLEIENKKNQIGELENKILQTYDQESEYKAQVEELSQETSQLGKQLEEYQGELEEISQLTQEEENNLFNNREKITSHIEKTLLHRYERIRDAKNGIAVARVERNSCGGCFSALPPQKLAEIRESDRLFTCEFCGRILVWDED